MAKKILEGIVVSDKMQKTRVVLVTTYTRHRLYDRFIAKRTKYKVHDEMNSAKKGDRVRIIESRPYSKEKRFRILEIIK
ncbi:MAG: 30S ribosomal protein S17 [Candidatus Omnitrophica bacterium]|nr:30S ribosomal protein S17 [Candidatus Omnitrophota bacterium]MCM8831448.1 30S ribosomal protein S17 [Candidatus Omnitrophota bacterium]